jgi:DNA-binding NarL/FixJ family response regulator
MWMSEEELRQRFGLTTRELAVTHLLARGQRNAQIAAELGISKHTAERHTEKILTKLGVRSRAAIAARIMNQASRL